jgi:phage tail-like protein
MAEERPFVSFNFRIEISVDGLSKQLCEASFSEVDGLEMTVEPKTIREGGRNTGPVHMLGPVGYGNLTLKRGMTPNFDLWRWFERVNTPGQFGLRGSAQVLLLASTAGTETVNARWVLSGCLPIKLKAPTLNAKEGQVAVEELQIAYESLSLES